MPAPRGCSKHCVIWTGNASVLYRRCAHCLVELSRHQVCDSRLLASQVQQSIAGHDAVCPTPYRQPIRRTA